MPTNTDHRVPEIWMEVIDPKRIAKLIAIQGTSARKVSLAAGWKSHTYMQRILKGEEKNVRPEPAVRIAYYFGVGTDDLFVARTSSEAGEVAKWERSVRQQRRAA